jgi:flagellar hook-basal body complex protein FliE
VTVPPIDPSAALGGDWQVPGLGALPQVDPAGASVDPAAGATGAAGGVQGGGFGSVLSQQVSNLAKLQDQAAGAAQSLADGTATDASSVVAAVERAQLAMQLAGQIRTKGAEAISDIFHTSI